MKTKMRVGMWLAAIAVAASVRAAADSLHPSYQVTVPAGGWAVVGYSYETSTDAVVFAGVPDGFMVYHWDEVAQTWVINSYDALFGWTNPDMLLKRGEAVMVRNPSNSALVLTITGTMPTDSHFDREFEPGKMYLIAYPYPLEITGDEQCVSSSFLECPPHPLCAGRYTCESLGYPAAEGDVVWLWNTTTAQWEPRERLDGTSMQSWTNEGTCVTPTILLGDGFWLKPSTLRSANVTWVALPGGSYCSN